LKNFSQGLSFRARLNLSPKAKKAAVSPAGLLSQQLAGRRQKFGTIPNFLLNFSKKAYKIAKLFVEFQTS
jgi:hypothetical protein